MNLLSDIITYVRRIIKSPSNSVITDDLIIDYINRFWIMDVDARMQLFDLKTSYQFQTVPGVDRYNMPLYNIQTEPGSQTIGMYPVYQGFLGPAYINGIQVPLNTQKENFFNIWPNIVQQLNVVAVGTGQAADVPYTINIPISNVPPFPINPPVQAILRGHIDITGIMATGQNVDPPVSDGTTFPSLIAEIPTTSISPAVYFTSIDVNGNSVVVCDSGVFLSSDANQGLLIQPGSAPFGNEILDGYGDGENTINYLTGVANITFPVVLPIGANINAQCFYFQTGLPRGILYYNNTLTLRSPPDQQYLVELEAYLSPAAFLVTSNAIPFGYMAEYIARGAARKILSDTGDFEQFQFYEPLFREQEMLVWKRSQRQWTASRTQTIYSQGINQGQSGFNNLGGSSV